MLVYGLQSAFTAFGLFGFGCVLFAPQFEVPLRTFRLPISLTTASLISRWDAGFRFSEPGIVWLLSCAQGSVIFTVSLERETRLGCSGGPVHLQDGAKSPSSKFRCFGIFLRSVTFFARSTAYLEHETQILHSGHLPAESRNQLRAFSPQFSLKQSGGDADRMDHSGEPCRLNEFRDKVWGFGFGESTNVGVIWGP